MHARSHFRYILLYKPYGVLSQFTPGRHEGTGRERETLRNLRSLPPGVYPAGRLDADSEGLLLLTDDPQVKHRLLEPTFGHPRTYLVQVERIPDEHSLERLRHGGMILDGRRTKPILIQRLDAEPLLPPRPVPIRFRKSVPTSWLEITLTEGIHRQVRRMTASIGHPTLRLVRVGIGELTLAGLQPGDWRALTPREVHSLRALVKLADSSVGQNGSRIKKHSLHFRRHWRR